jgi:hypothetical protein
MLADGHRVSERVFSVPYLYSINHKQTLMRLFSTLPGSNETIVSLNDLVLDRLSVRSIIHTEVPRLIHRFHLIKDIVFPTHAPLPFTKDTMYEWEIATQQEHDVILFIGWCTDRRNIVLKALERLFLLNHLHGTLSQTMQFYSFCDRSYYYNYDYYILKAKVIVNIASSNISIFESHRINYLLSLGKVVLSEMGADETIAKRYRDGLILLPNGNTETVDQLSAHVNDIYDIVTKLASNATMLLQQSLTAQRFYSDVFLVQSMQELGSAIDATLSYFMNS